MYSQKDVARFIGVSESQVRYWDKVGLIAATEKKDGRLWFDFKALVAFRTVRQLQNQGLSTRKIVKCVNQVKHRMPHAGQPLTEFKITTIGDEMVIGKDNQRCTSDGQILFDFDPPGKGAEETPTVTLPACVEEDTFFQALSHEDNSQWKMAEKKYEALLDQDPEHTDALVNLGNIRFMFGDAPAAEACYRRALCIDPDHVTANFNLANLFDDRGEAENAMLFYIKALNEDPEFPDAHCNLGMVLEKLGNRKAAKIHWQQYLELEPEPDGEMVRFIRARMHDGE
ncbi:MAG: tetratricopeptide repeat protein [Thermodesulfobacteriota bacterium]